MAEFNNLTPITRREQFLQDIADGTVDKTPITREEWFLAQIADAVHSGGGGGGLPAYTDADADKGLFLKRGTKTVVPEQSLTFIEVSGIYTAEVNGADFSGLSDNGTVVVTMKTKEAYGGETSTADGIYSASDNTITVSDSGIVFTIYTDKAEISGDGASVMASAIDTATAFITPVAPAWTNALPSVTAADNGDVLTVVDGAWDKAAPNTVVLNITFQNTDSGVIVNRYTADKTYAEIAAAIIAGKRVVMRYVSLDDSGEETPLSLWYCDNVEYRPQAQVIEFFSEVHALDTETGTVEVQCQSLYYFAATIPVVAPDGMLYESYEYEVTII